MAKVFYPQASSQIMANSPHPPDTEYKISIGTEMWGNIPASVIKVQMVYKGKVNGRVVPSFPLGTDDYQRVRKAIDELLSR